MIEWNIQSRAHYCQSCEAQFQDKQPYHTLLIDTKKEFARTDVCESCWESKYGNKGEQGVVSYWKGIYEAPPPAPPEPIHKQTAETLLRELIEKNDPKHGPACYILAVMLERKRLLKVKEEIRREGSRVFIYEQPKTGDIFTITDPELQLDQLQEVQKDVAQLLEHGLNPPPPPLAEEAPPQSEAAPIAAEAEPTKESS